MAASFASRIPRGISLMAAVALVLIGWELWLRQFECRRALAHDPDLEGELVDAPGEQVWGLEGRGHSVWMAHGIRRPALPSGTTARVLVLGDSFTEALQVDDGETFSDVAERDLQRSGVNVAVLNAGVMGRSVADYVAFASVYRRLLTPVWTVVQLEDNDLTDDAWDASKLHFVVQPDGTLGTVRVPYTPTGLHLVFWKLLQRSSLLAIFMKQLYAYRDAARKEPRMFHGAEPSLAPVERAKLAAPVETELDLLVDAFDRRLTILYLPMEERESQTAMTDTERRTRAYCEAHGIRLVSTREALAREWSATGWSPWGLPNMPYAEGHLNERGHAIVGGLLSQDLRRVVDDVVH